MQILEIKVLNKNINDTRVRQEKLNSNIHTNVSFMSSAML